MPLIMCYLEGLHHQEVAHRLGCPVGTVESRLSRARERLRSRLVRRGLAPTGAVMIAAVTPSGAWAANSPLADSTLRAALRLAAKGGHGGRLVVGSLFWKCVPTMILARVSGIREQMRG